MYSDSTDHSINLDGAPINSESQVNERENQEHMGPKARDLPEFRNASVRDAAHVFILPRDLRSSLIVASALASGFRKFPVRLTNEPSHAGVSGA